MFAARLATVFNRSNGIIRRRPASYTRGFGVAIATAVVVTACEKPVVDPPESLSEGCLVDGCHVNVEQIHYGGPRLTCVDCHLGDPGAITKEAAHVTVDISFNPSTPGNQYIDSPSLAELDELPLDVVQFINPADYRVVLRTCGSSVIGGGNCHATISENSVLLNRATLAGTFAGGGFIAGLQDKQPKFGIAEIVDPHTPEVLPQGIIKRVLPLPAQAPDDVTDATARAFYPVLEQLCVECHVNQDGPKVPGRYYSSGCSSCHIVTADDSRAKTADETQNREEPGHVETHRLTNLIPDSQCAHCHISHLGRSLLSIGVRERSEPEGDTGIGGQNHGIEDPEHQVPWGKENYVKHEGILWQYGKPYPYFIEDEDGRNEVDETPPDVHTAAGLACIDCHNIREAHGDRHMAERMDLELDVRCQSCHGRPGELATRQSDAGLSFSRSGTTVAGVGENETVFVLDNDDMVQQLGRFTNVLHPVTQITHRTDPDSEQHNVRTRAGCALHAGTAAQRAAVKRAVNALAETDPDAVPEAFPGLPAGFSFSELPDMESDGRVECFACHNSWTANCYGCHIVRDDRESYRSRLTGEMRKGKVSTHGLSVVADALSLGFNARGRITPMVGTSIFFTHIDESGDKAIDTAALTTGEGLSGDGNVHNPAHHHTIQRQPRDCDGCHPSATDSHDDKELLRAIGAGTTQFTFTDGAGKEHALDRITRITEADYDGDGAADPVVEDSLPKTVLALERVAGTTHVSILEASAGPPPGPLDLETINLVLRSVVVPQRPDESEPTP